MSVTEWVGSKPPSWPLVRIKHVCRTAGGGTPDKSKSHYWQGEIPWVSPKDMKSDRIIDTEDHITAEGLSNSATQMVPPNSVILVMRSGILRHSIPVAINEVPVSLNQDMRAFLPDNRLAPLFLARLVEGHQSELLQAWSKVGATVESLESDLIGDTLIPLPPRHEQEAILAFLDRETARLDALVAAKQSQIDLLIEKRKAIIATAVTRGLDPKVKLRDSGVPWLGEIPAHWETKRLRYLGQPLIGLTYAPADVVMGGSGTLVLRASNVQDQRIVLDDNVYVTTAIPPELVTRLGDILICSRSGSRALIGKCALIDSESEGMTFGAFMTVFRGDYNSYLFHVFNSPLFEYQAGAFGTSTINQLTVETLKNMEVPLPPADERQVIVEHIERETAKLDAVCAATRRTIALLSERRSALISAAVTGQLDVGAAA